MARNTLAQQHTRLEETARRSSLLFLSSVSTDDEQPWAWSTAHGRGAKELTVDRQAPPARSRAAAIYADVGCPRDAHAGSIQFALLSAVLVVALVLHEPRQKFLLSVHFILLHKKAQI